MPANLSRPEPLKTIQPGDPWQFLGCNETMMSTAHALGVGGILDWTAPAEHQPRQFKIVAIHDNVNAIECSYVGWIENARPAV